MLKVEIQFECMNTWAICVCARILGKELVLQYAKDFLRVHKIIPIEYGTHLCVQIGKNELLCKRYTVHNRYKKCMFAYSHTHTHTRAKKNLSFAASRFSGSHIHDSASLEHLLSSMF